MKKLKGYQLTPIGSILGIALIFGVCFYLWHKVTYFLSSEKAAIHWVASSKATLKEEEKEEKEESDSPEEFIRQNFAQMADPATGMIPYDRAFSVMAKSEKYRRENNSNMNKMMASPVGVWSERGPNNVGGRTRSIVYDRHSATPNKVWAGSVGGGLWYTTDITNGATGWTKVSDIWNNMAVTSIAIHPSNADIMYVGTGEGFYNMDAIQGGGIFKSNDGGSSWSLLSSTTCSGSPATCVNNQGNFDAVQKVIVTSTGAIIAATRGYYVNHAGLMRSSNGGSSWTNVLNTYAPPPTSIYSRGADLEVGADGAIYAAMGLSNTDGIYKSIDDGVTWVKLNTGANGFPITGFRRIEIATAPSDASVIYAITQGTGSGVGDLYKSVDGGANWVTISKPVSNDPGTGTTDISRGQAWYDLLLAVDPNDANTVIVGAIDIYKSIDGGTNWSQLTRWHNGYGSSSQSTVHSDQHVAFFKDNSSSNLVVGNDGGIYFSANANSTTPSFSVRNTNYNVTQYYAGDLSPTSGSNVMLAGSQDNGTQRYTTSGINTTLMAIGGDGAYTHIDQDNANWVFGGYTNNNLYFSSNAGATFSSFNSESDGLFINPTEYDDKSNLLFSNCSTSSVTCLYRFSGFGGTIVKDTFTLTGPTAGTQITAIRASPYDASTSTIYLGTINGQLYKLTNMQSTTPGTIAISNIAGASFPTGYISSIEVGSNENNLIVTFSNFGVVSVWATTDGGVSWFNKEGNLPDMPIRWANILSDDNKQVLLATEVGVWYTNDFSATNPVWVLDSTFPLVRTDMIQRRTSDNTVMGVTHGRGVWTSVLNIANPLPIELVSFSSRLYDKQVIMQWETASESNNEGFDIEHSTDAITWNQLGFVQGNGTSSVSHKYSFSTDNLPIGTHYFRLKQRDFSGAIKYSENVRVLIEVTGKFLFNPAYPNPFNPETTIEFGVPVSQNVKVEVYNTLGQRVAMLYNGKVIANELQKVQLNGANLPSGFYMVRLLGENFNQTQKITLLK